MSISLGKLRLYLFLLFVSHEALATSYQADIIAGDSLEVQYENEWLNLPPNEETLMDESFLDFLYPNEKNVSEISKHLNRDSHAGVIVSAGTERSFFNLIQCEKCTGLIVRDVNPRVKAYMDLNILMLQISESLEDYQQLSSPLLTSTPYKGKNGKPFSISKRTHKKQVKTTAATISKSVYIELVAKEEYQARKADLIERIERSMLFSDVKRDYYIRNLDTLMQVFFAETHGWRLNKSFAVVNYSQNNAQYLKLKRFIDQGNIITTIGSIADLEFIRTPVSIVDVSNILDYVSFSFGFSPEALDFPPRIVWTRLVGFKEGFVYFSFPWEVQAVSDSEEFLHKVKQVKETYTREYYNLLMTSDEISVFNVANWNIPTPFAAITPVRAFVESKWHSLNFCGLIALDDE